jgi:NADH dehydrogenase FAD-containing subunit
LLSQSQIVPELSRRARDIIRQHLLHGGVQLHEGASVQQIERDAVWWTDGSATAPQRSAAAVCVWAGGFVGSPLPRQAGLLANAREQVLVDASFRSLSHPEVSVVGDAAGVQGGAAGQLHLSCKVAMYMAPAIADNLVRRHLKLPEVPFVFSDGGVCISLGRRAGVIDRRWPDGTPREQIISGRSGALLKELVCRYTVLRMRAERAGLWPLLPLDGPQRLPTSDRRQIAA